MRYIAGLGLALALCVMGCSETSGTGGLHGDGGSGGVGGDGGHGGCAEPLDVAGPWQVISTVLSDNCDGRTSTSFPMTITQDGNALTAETPELAFDGSICGDRIEMSGSFPDDSGTVTVNATLVVSNDGDSMEGSDTWIWTDGSASCEGSDSLSGTRLQIDVNWNASIDFTQFEAFSVVTADLVNPPPQVPDLSDEQELFNSLVNALIVEAMQNEPVCLELIPPEEVTPENQPDVWAANGLARSTDEGYVYACCGGWWWGYWGWYWDPCRYWCSSYLEYDVGNLFVPVGLPPEEGQDPSVFAGLARSLVNPGMQPEVMVRFAVQEIFRQWPDRRQCPR